MEEPPLALWGRDTVFLCRCPDRRVVVYHPPRDGQARNPREGRFGDFPILYHRLHPVPFPLHMAHGLRKAGQTAGGCFRSGNHLHVGRHLRQWMVFCRSVDRNLVMHVADVPDNLRHSPRRRDRRQCQDSGFRSDYGHPRRSVDNASPGAYIRQMRHR